MSTHSVAAVSSSISSSNDGFRQRAGILTLVVTLLLFSIAGASTAQAQTETVLHNFGGFNDNHGPDGDFPKYSGLVMDTAGNLYGTTFFGGAYDQGTVFKIDHSGNESLFHSFPGDGGDGSNPSWGLTIDTAGNLYGTTDFGGSYQHGTIFKIDSSGHEIVLYSFTGSSDGAYPVGAPVRDSAGNLYGISAVLNPSCCYEAIYKLDPSGSFTVLHNVFLNGSSDNITFNGGLSMDSAGNLYSTTQDSTSLEGGMVFKIDTSGNYSVYHSFSGPPGLTGPHSEELIFDSAGNLYGTAQDGTYNGVIFKLDSSGNETVLYTFPGYPNDGQFANGHLLRDSSGNLYGTTNGGGAYGQGTVFKIDSSGHEVWLYSFTGVTNITDYTNTPDGAIPLAGVIMDSAGNLYGTTPYGGSVGLGTVFKIVPPVPFSAFSAKLDVTGKGKPWFDLSCAFTLGAGATAIDPLTQDVKLKVGTYSVTIPAGSFKKVVGGYVYEGTINGVALSVRISGKGGSAYGLQAEVFGVDLSKLANPITVNLTIGNNKGTTQVNASH